MRELSPRLTEFSTGVYPFSNGGQKPTTTSRASTTDTDAPVAILTVLRVTESAVKVVAEKADWIACIGLTWAGFLIDSNVRKTV